MQQTEYLDVTLGSEGVEKQTKKTLQEVFHGEDVKSLMDDRLSELELEGHSLSRRVEISKRTYDKISTGAGKYYDKRQRRKRRGK